MKQYMYFLLVVWGVIMVNISCFHPDVTDLGAIWGGITGLIFTCGGYLGIIFDSKNE